MKTVLPWEEKPPNWEVLHCEWIPENGWFEYTICDQFALWQSEIFTVIMIPKSELKYMWE